MGRLQVHLLGGVYVESLCGAEGLEIMKECLKEVRGCVQVWMCGSNNCNVTCSHTMSTAAAAVTKGVIQVFPEIFL